ncbi:MAG: tRNA (guanosine(46)-N7)-methyltransferase TrmB, partial [Cytophagales bacterium]|nr:tRNA (guanosine(46)-N7)-methyltransferase TrmB [Cytophagales bacterium]
MSNRQIPDLILIKKPLARPNKLARYTANFESSNVIESNKPIYENIRGRWKSDYFENTNPITLELACGKGEYTVGLAQKIPNRNYIGIDLKGDRIFIGSRMAQQMELGNVGFIRSRIELLPEIFVPNEIDEIWLTFPDPRPKDRDEKHRLTNMVYMNLYQEILNPGGWFRFKTDNTFLFDYTLNVLKEVRIQQLEFTYNLCNSDLLEEHHDIQTKYEKLWSAKGESI